MSLFQPRPYAEVVESVLEAMTSPPSPLSDRAVGSVTRTLAEAFGREIAFMQRQLMQVYLWGYVDTAEGEALDRVVAILGITRRRQSTAAGQVVFQRKPGTSGEITIPAGTRLSAGEDPVTFETTAEVHLADGEATGVAEIRALVEGRKGIVEAGAIAVMNRPIAGISGVTNPEGTALGAPTETDEQLRERARRALERAGKATLNAIRYGLMEAPGVRGVTVMDDPERQPGVVKVMIDLEREEESPRVLAALDELRAAGIRAFHNLPGSSRDYDASLQVSLVRVEVSCRLAFESEAIPPAERDRALQEVRGALNAYLSSLEVGQSISLNRMVALAMAVDGVSNVELGVEAEDGRPVYNGQIEAQPTERFAVQGVTVGPMAVYLDLALRLTLPPEKGLSPESVRDGIRRQLQSYLEPIRTRTVTEPATLSIGDWLVESLGGTIYGQLPIHVQEVTATYVGRGLVRRKLTAADLVELARWESPVLREYRAIVE